MGTLHWGGGGGGLAKPGSYIHVQRGFEHVETIHASGDLQEWLDAFVRRNTADLPVLEEEDWRRW